MDRLEEDLHLRIAQGPDPKSTPISPPKRVSPDWGDAGYPKRHREALERAVKGPDGRWLKWPEKTARLLSEAHRRLVAGDTFIVLIGPRGTGKTQAAIQLATRLDLDLQPEKITQQYTTLGELFESIKESWNSKGGGAKPLVRAEEAGLLILDEIQSTMSSDWEKTVWTRLIDKRYTNMRRTILIGNLTCEGVKQFALASAYSRIQECGMVIEMDETKFRKQTPHQKV